MIAWMLYALAIGALLGVAGVALERGLRLFRLPVRLVWVVAMTASVVLPLVGALVSAAAPAALGLTLPPVIVGNRVWSIPLAALGRVAPATVRIDAALGATWLVTSVALVGWLAWARVRLAGERRHWGRETIDGVSVYVSADVGPAVVDPIAGGIVVPRWLLAEASVAERHAALRHEREHLRAGDAWLVWFGAIVAAAFPWNPFLWWQLRRLRATVELDCDRRVLAGGISPATYADLLLRVGGRRLALFGPALTEPRSVLGWRIGAMIETPVRHRHARCALYAVAASGLVFLACDTPVPRTSADQVAGPDQHAALGSDVVYADANSELVPPERVSCPVPEYPEALRDAGRQGQVMTQFVVGADGSVEPATVEIISSSDSAFDTSARDMVARCRFRAGTVNDEAVRVLTQMPVVFRLGGPESLGASSDGGNRGGDTGSIIVRRSSADTVPPPIYIVDGVIVQNGSALDLDALRIESIEVVKGEQARQRYGERGRNGVILITTKK